MKDAHDGSYYHTDDLLNANIFTLVIANICFRHVHHGAWNSTRTSLVLSRTTLLKLSAISTTTLDGTVAIFTLVPTKSSTYLEMTY